MHISSPKHSLTHTHMHTHAHKIFLLHCQGLEEIVQDELKRVVGASDIEVDDGHIYFNTSTNPAELCALRSVERVLALVARRQVKAQVCLILYHSSPPARETLFHLSRSSHPFFPQHCLQVDSEEVERRVFRRLKKTNWRPLISTWNKSNGVVCPELDPDGREDESPVPLTGEFRICVKASGAISKFVYPVRKYLRSLCA
jgi:hypothetical protein